MKRKRTEFDKLVQLDKFVESLAVLQNKYFHLLISKLRSVRGLTPNEYCLLIFYLQKDRILSEADIKLYEYLKAKMPERVGSTWTFALHQYSTISASDVFLYALVCKYWKCGRSIEEDNDTAYYLFEYCQNQGRIPYACYHYFRNHVKRQLDINDQTEAEETEKFRQQAVLTQDPLALFFFGKKYAREGNWKDGSRYLQLAYLFGHMKAKDMMFNLMMSNFDISPFGRWQPNLHQFCSAAVKSQIFTALLLFKRLAVLYPIGRDVVLMIVELICTLSNSLLPLYTPTHIRHLKKKISRPDPINLDSSSNEDVIIDD